MRSYSTDSFVSFQSHIFICLLDSSFIKGIILLRQDAEGKDLSIPKARRLTVSFPSLVFSLSSVGNPNQIGTSQGGLSSLRARVLQATVCYMCYFS